MRKRRKWHFQSSRQVLSIGKILLGSRAFIQEEMEELLENLIACVPMEDRETVRRALGAERADYQPAFSAAPVLDRLWEAETHIARQDIIRFDYVRQDGKRCSRTAVPAATLFSENYFYLLAHYIPRQKSKPAILRLDRIENMRATGEKISVPRGRSEMVMRQSPFMYGGREITILFKFWGDSWQAVLDRLPGARVIGQDADGKRLIQAQASGEGIKMWLLSQMDRLEVLEPLFLRREIAKIVQNLNEIYR